jgi:hypothetical protein
MPLAALIEKLYSFTGGRRVRHDRSAARKPRQGRFQPRVESLEDRRLLSISPLLAHAPAVQAPAVHATTSAITTTLQDRPGTSIYGQPVQLSARVTGATGGNVEFMDGSTLVGSNTLSGNGVSVYTTNSLTVGQHPITAEYFLPTNSTTVPDSSSSIITEFVDPDPTHTQIVASGNPGVAGTNITFTAVVGAAYPFSGASGQTAPPAGSVTFVVTNTTGNAAVPGTTTYNSTTGTATFMPTSALGVGTYTVAATFTPSSSNYAMSTSRTFVEQVVAATSVGTGTVSTGTSGSVMLRGGQQVGINVTQTLNTATTPTSLAESGSVTYVDTSHGNNIDLVGTTITSVVFSANGHQAEITGTGTNGTGGPAVSFTMLVDSGGGGWWSQPSVAIAISGASINYQQYGSVASGAIGVTVVNKGTTPIEPMGGACAMALESLFQGGLWFQRW